MSYVSYYLTFFLIIGIKINFINRIKLKWNYLIILYTNSFPMEKREGHKNSWNIFKTLVPLRIITFSPSFFLTTLTLLYSFLILFTFSLSLFLIRIDSISVQSPRQGGKKSIPRRACPPRFKCKFTNDQFVRRRGERKWIAPVMERRGVAWRPPPGILLDRPPPPPPWPIAYPLTIAKFVEVARDLRHERNAEWQETPSRNNLKPCQFLCPNRSTIETIPFGNASPFSSKERFKVFPPSPVHFLASRRLIETGTVSNKGEAFVRFVDTVFILFGGKFVRWNGILTIVFFSLFLFENWFFSWIETI